jgi:HPt (histidine-containing phosphotransfer) domain-containing protein
MIDWDRVEELRSEIGDEGFGEVVELFLEEVESVITRLGSAPDPARFEDDLHFLKGSAWNLGFAAFGARCQEGERKAAAGRGAEIDIAAILACYGASRKQFMARLQQVRSTGGRSAAA